MFRLHRIVVAIGLGCAIVRPVWAADDNLPKGASVRLGKFDARKQVETGPLTFSPDGKRLAVAEAGKTVVIWDVAAGKEHRRLKPLESLVTALAFDARGDRLGVGDLAGKLQVVDVKTGEPKESHQKQKDSPVSAIVFKPDGTIVATWGGRLGQGAVWVWDSSNGKEKDGRQVVDMATCAALSGDGKKVAWVGPPRAISNGSLHVLDLAPGSKPKEIPPHCEFISSVVWSANGSHVAADGGDSGDLCIYDVATLRTRNLKMEGYDLGKLGAFGESGKLFAFRKANESIQIIGVDDGKTRHELAHPGGCRALALSPDARTLASVAADGSVLVFPLPPGK